MVFFLRRLCPVFLKCTFCSAVLFILSRWLLRKLPGSPPPIGR